MVKNIHQKRRDEAYFASFDRRIDSTAKKYDNYNLALEIVIVLALLVGTGCLINLAYYELTHML